MHQTESNFVLCQEFLLEFLEGCPFFDGRMSDVTEAALFHANQVPQEIGDFSNEASVGFVDTHKFPSIFIHQ